MKGKTRTDKGKTIVDLSPSKLADLLETMASVASAEMSNGLMNEARAAAEALRGLEPASLPDAYSEGDDIFRLGQVLVQDHAR